jgi:hypothetical protein
MMTLASRSSLWARSRPKFESVPIKRQPLEQEKSAYNIVSGNTQQDDREDIGSVQDTWELPL